MMLATFLDTVSTLAAWANAECKTLCAWPTVPAAARGRPFRPPDRSKILCQSAICAGRSFCKSGAPRCGISWCSASTSAQ